MARRAAGALDVTHDARDADSPEAVRIATDVLVIQTTSREVGCGERVVTA